ncbi:DUF6527 family protein [Bradyrhizobium sp. USDA 336]|uniref:DUF6527 family protein n=1 Tax=Bradyrhizobium sp. USDA 336 TaxID=3156311 RepID=UPI003834C623
MIRHQRLKHQFVEHIPERLAPGVLYVSIEYATSAHSCCCGCGAEVVTPFTPTDWRMTFDGETISLSPSVGNWNIACRSHYFIDRGRVVEAAPWTDKQIASERVRDKEAKALFYGTREATELNSPPAPVGKGHEAHDKGLLRRLMSKLGWGD